MDRVKKTYAAIYPRARRRYLDSLDDDALVVLPIRWTYSPLEHVFALAKFPEFELIKVSTTG